MGRPWSTWARSAWRAARSRCRCGRAGGAAGTPGRRRCRLKPCCTCVDPVAASAVSSPAAWPLPCPPQWHPRINQIFVGCGGRTGGGVRTFYDPALSNKGAVSAASRAPRQDTTEFVSVRCRGRWGCRACWGRLHACWPPVGRGGAVGCVAGWEASGHCHAPVPRPDASPAAPLPAAGRAQDLCAQRAAHVSRGHAGAAPVQEAAGGEGGRGSQVHACAGQPGQGCAGWEHPLRLPRGEEGRKRGGERGEDLHGLAPRPAGPPALPLWPQAWARRARLAPRAARCSRSTC